MRSSQQWQIRSWSIYVVLLIPASILAYVGLLWVDTLERGWRTQIAAAALIAAWFPLALGARYTWTTAKTGAGRKYLSDAAFFLTALPLYAVALVWGGGMLI